MTVEVIMPRLTHDMQTGTLLRWLVKAGESVKRGDLLFEVETDKAVAEVTAEADGVLRGVRVQEGDQVPIGEIIAYIAGPDEDLPQPFKKVDNSISFEAALAQESDHPAHPAESIEKRPRIIASPIAKRIARDSGIDLSQLVGSGPRGRITEKDVRAYEARPEKTAPQAETVVQGLHLTPIELATGRRMVDSIRTIPQFTLEIDVDMSEASRWRKRYNQEADTKVSYTALLLRTMASALNRQPRLNSRLDGETLIRYPQVNLGVAVATAKGLMVPVIRHVESLNLEQIQEELKLLQTQAQNNRLPAERLSGAALTLTNLGMFGIDRFQALINPPETAILAVGRMREQPVVVDGVVKVRPTMTLRLSVDHRVADGATAAPFLVEINRLLSNPYLLL